MMERKASVLLHLDWLKAVCMSVDEGKGVPVFGQEINMSSNHRTHIGANWSSKQPVEVEGVLPMAGGLE